VSWLKTCVAMKFVEDDDNDDDDDDVPVTGRQGMRVSDDSDGS